MQSKTLREIRLGRDMYQSDIAHKAEISTPFYSMIESGNRNPSIKTAQKIAAILGISLDQLYRSLYQEEEEGEVK